MRIIEETERIMAANAHWNAAGTPALRRLAEADKLLAQPCRNCNGTGYVEPSPLMQLLANIALCACPPGIARPDNRVVTRVNCLTCGGSGKRP